MVVVPNSAHANPLIRCIRFLTIILSFLDFINKINSNFKAVTSVLFVNESNKYEYKEVKEDMENWAFDVLNTFKSIISVHFHELHDVNSQRNEELDLNGFGRAAYFKIVSKVKSQSFKFFLYLILFI